MRLELDEAMLRRDDAHCHQATVAPDHTVLSPEAAETISGDQRLKLALERIIRCEGLLRPLLAEQGVADLDALRKIISHDCLVKAHVGHSGEGRPAAPRRGVGSGMRFQEAVHMRRDTVRGLDQDRVLEPVEDH